MIACASADIAADDEQLPLLNVASGMVSPSSQNCSGSASATRFVATPNFSAAAVSQGPALNVAAQNQLPASLQFVAPNLDESPSDDSASRVSDNKPVDQ